MRWLVLLPLILAVSCNSGADDHAPCEYMGETYAFGELWLPDDCNACMCTELGAECTAVACEQCTATPIDDCFTSHGYADCGAAPFPNFGCHPDTYDCRWFEGCLAEGYLRSPCGAGDDLCCADGHPFSDREFPALQQEELFGWFFGHGTEPWTRIRGLDVDVVIDPDLAPDSFEITCDPDGGPGTPCGTPTAVAELGDVVAIQLANSDLGGWSMILEIDVTPTRADARVCQVPFTDAWAWRCSSFADPACATGSLTVNRIPAAEGELAGTVGTLDVTFDGGLHLTGSFQL